MRSGGFLSINHPLAALIAVHGAWDEWSPWSLCSSTCGRGYRDRIRTCKPPQFGGDECAGPEKQTKFCNIAVCPGKQLFNTNITGQLKVGHCVCNEYLFSVMIMTQI